jgi:hypothetical protein
MGQQQKIDLGGFEAERLFVFFFNLARPLVQPAVDQDTATVAVDQVT